MESNSASGRRLAALTLGALGVVYGDLGTSPLYALRECFAGSHPLPPTHDNVLGILSLIFWSLLLIVSLKYLAVVLRATNKGEGGILALMALAFPKHTPGSGRRWNWARDSGRTACRFSRSGRDSASRAAGARRRRR